MECKFCNRECKNKNSLINHERLCKLNPNYQKIKSNFISYNEKLKNGLVSKEYKNQYIKAKLENRIITISEETKKKISNSRKGNRLSEKHKKNISDSMKTTVLKYPESYSASNINGRTPIIEYNGFKLSGSWELEVAKWLDKNNIKWTNKVTPFEYEWENSLHLYFPDFYLIDIDKYIEVKGFERDRDRCKWAVVKNLIIIKQKDIKKIKNNDFSLDYI
jgi:hypothetical protein